MESPGTDGLVQREGILSQVADMVVDERGQALGVFRVDLYATSPQGLQDTIQVERVSDHDEVDHKPQRAQVLLLSFSIPLPDFAFLSKERVAG